MPATFQTRFLSDAEAGRRLAVGRRILAQLITDGTLKTLTIRPGSKPRILESSVEELLSRWHSQLQAG